MDVAGSSEHHFGTGAYAHVLSEILPAHGAGTVDQELGGTGNVMAIRPCRDVQQTVTPDYIQIGIGQERESEARLAAQGGRHLRQVHADRDRTNALLLEVLKVRLDAS